MQLIKFYTSLIIRQIKKNLLSKIFIGDTMKKKFVSKVKKKKRFKYKFLLFIVLFCISIFTTFKYLLKSNIKVDDKNLVKFLLADLDYDNNLFKEVVHYIKKD